MRNLLTSTGVFFLLLLIGSPALAQAPEDLQRQAERVQTLMTEAFDHIQAGSQLIEQAKGLEGDAAKSKQAEGIARYEQAVTNYDELLPILDDLDMGSGNPQIDQIRQVAYYNIACCRSLQGKTKAALDAFAKALDAGYDDFDHLEKDTDLDPIRKDPRFVQLLVRARGALEGEAKKAGKSALSSAALFAYDFKVKTLAGKTLSLKDLRGKVVIVDYWGTWCPPCRAEVPHFVELQKEFGDRLQIVGMTWEGGQAGAETLAKVKAFAKENKINYPLTLVSDRKALNKVPNLEGYPTTLFIDKSGRVRVKEVGYRDLNVLRSLISALDAEPGPKKRDPAPPKPKAGSLGPF